MFINHKIRQLLQYKISPGRKSRMSEKETALVGSALDKLINRNE